MKLKFRLAYYLFGLLLGIFFVIKFLGAKADAKGVEFCYLPNCRVLKELRNKPLDYSSEVKTILNENWISLEDIKKTLQYGDVDFSKSNKPYKNGKIYLIEGKTTKDENISVTVINYSSKVLLEKIEKK
ncbi:hypothetical protein SY27_03155 [Flavobacterium sp. 316]|uniref:DUF4258 domain-containing protein n=1 Tax=Flavobacterium sediminilitoris TaxID=2024526 RepID=A0ABY4HK82_9FLAO|nr:MULTISPECIES: DUF4258 domain-containing protein [Flavobacterium]KIX22825.1 hypothetical protein SY27_03155 [Flavobacterium sp. 316]UOX33269.1 DUF4258 domain-containing protein [Flavobacterium sediminilitoris]